MTIAAAPAGELSALFATIWDSPDEQVVPPWFLSLASSAGNQLLAAYDGSSLVGGSWGFITPTGLHSHITGVLPAYQATGLGLSLKHAQRDWCRARGIATVTWTFDPMIARNAAFNLRKLGAVAVGYLPNFYGEMNDQFNAGQETDRLSVEWHLDGGPSLVGEPVWVPAGTHRAALRDRMLPLFDAGYIACGFTNEGYQFRKTVAPKSS